MQKGSGFKQGKFGFIFIILAIVNLTANAEVHTVNELELSTIANLDKAALNNDQWQTVLPVLGDEDHYFIATQAGKIYQIHNNQISSSAFFDLKLALKNPNIVALTAITLDPNFHYRDRDGYHTFYTAHTETSKPTTAKLAPINAEVNSLYDTVLVRWKIDNLQTTPQVSQQYEVMRIAIMAVDEPIKQLSFNPYIEPWHDDFGLLFIALARNENLKNEALYAGSILRIKPEKYGLQKYTVPTNNPFSKKTEIPNEIIFIAGQKTEHFDWIKQSAYRLLLQFNQPDSSLLIEAKIGEDWREAVPQEQIKKQLPILDTKHKTLLYQGRDLKKLWGKVLHLQEKENDWQLQALTINSTDDVSNTPNISHKLINYKTNKQSKFSLHQKHNGELLLLEHSQQRLYSIKQPTAVVNNADKLQDLPSSSNSPNTLLILLCFVLIITGIFLYLRSTNAKKQGFFQQQWANFEVDMETKLILLYKRHNNAPEKNITISSLIRSEILLNNEVISTISADENQAFSNELETLVLAVFGSEHRIKMINDKHRKIQLRLTDDQKQHYMICLYYRVGNIRHTKLKYQQVIDTAIDWQWLFAQYINPTLTTKRKIKVKPIPEKVAPLSENKSAPVKATEREVFEDNSTEATQDIDLSINSFIDSTHEAPSTTKSSIDATEENTLVADLDKLVMMKKQGYLSETEFNAAKAKILKQVAND
jgi:hypothetical protein